MCCKNSREKGKVGPSDEASYKELFEHGREMGGSGSMISDAAVLEEFDQLLEAGQLKESQGDARGALLLFEQCLACAQHISDAEKAKEVKGKALGNLGIVYDDLGQVEDAIDHHTQALAIFKEIGKRRNEGTAVGKLGAAYESLNQVERGIGALGDATAAMQGAMVSMIRDDHRSWSVLEWAAFVVYGL